MSDRDELKAFVAQFPELARRVAAIADKLGSESCPECGAYRDNALDPHRPDCILSDLRAIVRETEFQEALNRG